MGESSVDLGTNPSPTTDSQLSIRYYSDPIWIVKSVSEGTLFHKAPSFHNNSGLLHQRATVNGYRMVVPQRSGW